MYINLYIRIAGECFIIVVIWKDFLKKNNTMLYYKNTTLALLGPQ